MRERKGRGATNNPKGRFEPFDVEYDYDDLDPNDERPRLKTRFYDDHSESVITYNKSPDIPFEASLNAYRGCEHGCAYCYARPTHEYLGFSAGLDFESKIMVKRAAPELLKRELSSRRWKPQVIAMSGVTDPYQPVERSLRLTRSCLQVLRDFRNPVGIVTKNRLILRDVDLLAEMAEQDLCSVSISLTTLDAELARKMEPRTSPPAARLEAIEGLAQAGVPVGILLSPVIPGLNDHEIASILKAAREAGASFASYILLRLPYGVKDIFFDWLAEAYPAKQDKVESRIRSIRGGTLNQTEFGKRFSGEGVFAEQIRQLFTAAHRREGYSSSGPELRRDLFRRVDDAQMDLGL